MAPPHHMHPVGGETRALVLAVSLAGLAAACFMPTAALAQSASAALPILTSGAAPSDENDEFLKQLLDANVAPIDLASALRLAGVQNSQILIAQQRVLEAVALRQLAAAQFLPTLNAGTNFDSHRGNLQQSRGTILGVSRDALYFGAGAYALAAGTVNIPGVAWTMNLSNGIYGYLISRQEVDRRAFVSRTVEQDQLLAVALAYIELVRAEGQRSVALQTRNDAAEVARLTAANLKSGQRRKADADRAATELARRETMLVQAEGEVGTASARLCQLLHLDPSLRLHPIDEHVLPQSIVPDPIPLPELLAIALLNRPELAERRVAVCQALLDLDRSRWLPFSPTVFIGYSAGSFGGGSNLVAQPPTNEPRFGAFDGRQAFDVMAYWTLLNLGVGNRAMIEAARSRLQSADLRQVATFDRVRTEVAAAYAKTHARFSQIKTSELAIQAGTEAYQEDMTRIIGDLGIPLELVNSLRLLARARAEYLNAILDYNAAQFQLYVALGKPPADLLVRPAGPDGQDPGARPAAMPPAPAPPAKERP